MEQGGEWGGAKVERVDEVGEQCKRGDRIEECIMPRFSGNEFLDLLAEAVVLAERGERVIRELGPSGAGEQEGIEPRPEAMAGEGAEESFFGALAMGDDDFAVQAHFHLGPEREQGGGGLQLLRADAMDFTGGPLDRLIGEEV